VQETGIPRGRTFSDVELTAGCTVPGAKDRLAESLRMQPVDVLSKREG